MPSTTWSSVLKNTQPTSDGSIKTYECTSDVNRGQVYRADVISGSAAHGQVYGGRSMDATREGRETLPPQESYRKLT